MESVLDVAPLELVMLSMIFLVVLIGFALTDWGLE